MNAEEKRDQIRQEAARIWADHYDLTAYVYRRTGPLGKVTICPAFFLLDSAGTICMLAIMFPALAYYELRANETFRRLFWRDKEDCPDE